MADVKWIKILVNIFDDEKVQLIESLPEGDSILVIWFKLLCLAGKQNNSGIFLLNDRIPYTDEMLATIFRRKTSTVHLALETFRQFDMIDIIDDVVTIPNWDKYQTLDAYEKKKVRDKEYQQARRAKQKQALDEKSSDNRLTVGRDCSYSYSLSINNIINYLNIKLNTKYKNNTNKNKTLIINRLKDGFTEDDFYKVIDSKYDDWHDNPKMKKYLRPETLFGTKFEGYLNEHPNEQPKAYTPTNMTEKEDEW